MSTEAVSTDLVSQDSAYAKRHRKLLDQLIAIGIENLVKVPKVVVVGSQSAGKSSILEALSGITFPRNVGTCTRCPSEVRLFYDKKDDWSCEVSLRFKMNAKGDPLDAVLTLPFGERITDASKVEARLLQAQRAILNPTTSLKSLSSFLNEEETIVKKELSNGDVKEVYEVQFSENVICINVTGKNVRDLSVVDLPGLIANVGENENVGNIDLIKNLAKTEIEKEDCIILSCITMSKDIQNQPAVMMAKTADPSGQRTLGVLTKPDRIEKGALANWKRVLEGEEHRLLHGYFVVKNPDFEDLGKVDWKQARAAEKVYFRGEPWSGSKFSSRLGSDKLADKLATLLEQIIKEKMPSIVAEVKALFAKVKEQLASLPKEMPDGQLLFHLSSLIRNFDQDLKVAALESQEENSLADDIYRISLDFWADMINHRPRFLPLTGSELATLCKMEKTFDNASGLKKVKEMRDYIFADDKAEIKGRGVVEREVLNEADDKTLVSSLMEPSKETVTYGSRSLKGGHVSSPLVLNLSDINNIKARATRDLLPNNTPWSVKQSIIRLCIQSWPEVTSTTLTNMQTILVNECNLLVKKHFSRFQIGGLENTVSRIMEKLINERVEKTEAFFHDLIKLESRYTTINTHKFLNRQAKLKMSFEEARKGCQLIIFGKNGKVDLQDKVDDELNLVSEILVYWQIAFKRYTDNVRSALYTILLEPITADCLDTLTKKLGIFDDDATSKVKGLLQEDQDTVHRRNELLANEATLTQSLEIIDAFWSGSLHVEE